MDDLIKSIGGDAIDLNIVCEDVTTSNSQSHPLKRKKNNKYEKRRAKALRAKEQKAKKENQSHLQNSAKGSLEDVGENVTDCTPKADAGRQIMGEQSLMISTEQESQAVQQENTTEVKDIRKKKDVVESTMEKGKSLKKSILPKNSSTWMMHAASEPQSRKKSHEITSKVLQDESSRALYLSTYHARPYEMDRKSGAVSHFQKSKDSMHIFGDAECDDDLQHSNVEHSPSEQDALHPFRQYGVHERIAKALVSDKFNLKRPTMIQINSWNQMIAKDSSCTATGKNLFIQSETGSGKTLAFLVPLLQSLAIDQRTKQIKRVDRSLGGTRATILCPTRELATQTYSTAEKLCLNSFPWLVSGCLSGGEKRKSEKARLRKGVSILIATPGRLLDHLEKTDCLLMALKGKLEWIVLDESDRLLDMGLGSQVEQIVQMVRANQPGSGPKRDGITWQSILVSATITKQVEKLSSKLLGGETWLWARAKKNESDDKLIQQKEQSCDMDSTDAMELSNAAPQQLTQLHMVVSSKLRLAALVAFLTARAQNKERVVVFMSTCDGVDYHYKLFQEMSSILPNDRDTANSKMNVHGGLFGNQCTFYHLHGNIPHRERHSIITEFSQMNQNQGCILITTDVSARGLNLPSVDWIVQYDPPCETADYVHRAGRAARAGKSGHALLFLLPSEVQYIEVLKLRGLPDITALSLSSTLQTAAKLCPELTTEGLQQTGQGSKTSDSRIGEAFASAIQTRLENQVLDDDRQYKESLTKMISTHKSTTEGNGSNKKQQQQNKKKEKRQAKNAVGPLLESARNAYHAYVRGYSTKEKAVRHIFSARALHLGHVARSFALKEQPKELSKAQRNARREDSDILKSTGRKRNHALAFGGTHHHTNHDNPSSLKADTGALVSEQVLASLVSSEFLPTQKEPENKRATTRKKQRTVSFDDHEDPNLHQKRGERAPTTQQKIPQGKEEFLNAKARMLAAANKVQSGGMEFF